MIAMLTWILAIALTAVLVDVARRLAPAVGLVDAPNHRKAHQGEIPLVGGVGIFAGLLVVATFTGLLTDHWAFVVSGMMLVMVGVWDDVYGISPIIRLILQATAVLFLALFGNAYLANLGQLVPGLGSIDLGWMAIPFTVFAGVGIINAFNMSDGVDGLCGSLSLIALVGFGVLAAVAGMQSELALIAVLTGALIGFLFFNMRLPGRKQASVFLGDAGSYLLGLSVLYAAIVLSQGELSAMSPVTALWFCMLPLFDTGGMILRRLKRGRSPFSPDREHLHHVFLLAKFTVGQTLAGLAFIAFIGMVAGLVGTVAGVPESVMLITFLVGAGLYYRMIMRAWKVMKFLSRSINRRRAAAADRRIGIDRRQNTSKAYVNGVFVERRSGVDRRGTGNDRRNDAGAKDIPPVPVIVKSAQPERPGSRAARVS